MSVIKVEDLSYVYGKGTPSEKVAIDKINLEVKKGEFIGLIGHTGSGKSTFIKHLNGLLKPSKGNVYIDGENIWDNSSKIRNLRFKVGLVFQYPEYQLFEDTVYKDIEFGPINMGLSENDRKKRVKMAADFVGLEYGLLEKSPFELSGGEKRKAAIAGVISMDPDILILDEPTAGLDPRGKDEFLNHIKRYHKERKNTIIWVSHSMEDIAMISDRVIVMNKGKVVMFDSTKNVFFRDKELEKMGLRIPQITRIMSRLKDNGFDIDSGILTVDQAVNEILRYLKRREID